MMVGQLHDLPGIDAEVVAEFRYFICKGDIDVAESIFGELHHLCDLAARRYQLSLNKGLVELGGERRRTFGKTADDPIVVKQLGYHVARNDALGTIGDENVMLLFSLAGEGEVGAQPGELVRQHLRRAHRRGGLEDDQVTAS